MSKNFKTNNEEINLLELILIVWKGKWKIALLIIISFITMISYQSTQIKKFTAITEIKNIGIRHGEKLHETLLTSEEFSKSEEFDNYFKVPLDSRDLNYNTKSEKESEIKLDNDYNSLKTNQLSVDEVVDKLLELSYIQDLINK